MALKMVCSKFYQILTGGLKILALQAGKFFRIFCCRLFWIQLRHVIMCMLIWTFIVSKYIAERGEFCADMGLHYT